MFVGHALLAFALVARVALWRGRDRGRALALGALAGGFAAVPDVDIAYAPLGVLTAETTDALLLAQSFWAAGNVVHRAITHSLVVAPLVALVVACWVAGRVPQRAQAAGTPVDGSAAGSIAAFATGPGLPLRVASVALGGAFVLVAGGQSGLLGGAVALLFVLGSIGLAEASVHRTPFAPVTVFVVALVGLASHPFGDLLTGSPPALFYPLSAPVVVERVTLHADPTLHLLGAFGVELATVWLGVTTFLHLVDVRPAVDSRAALGATYAAGILVVPAPTLDVSYQFVFSVLAVGSVGLFPRIRLDRRSERSTPGDAQDSSGENVPSAGSGAPQADGGVRPPVAGRRLPVSLELPDAANVVVTALAAITLAWLGYALAYLVVY